MENNFELDFTKFFDVQSPVGNLQGDKEGKEFPDVGVDTYMPRPTNEFIKALLKSNPDYILGGIDFKHDKPKEIDYFWIGRKSNSLVDDDTTKLVMRYEKGKYYICGTITIPSGIGILIPKGYHVNYRSKSSNFNNGYSVVEGLIDCPYTFSSGVQMFPINDKEICVAPNQKIAQIELVKTNVIAKMNFIPLEVWEQRTDVYSRRQNRAGGFGHTGKFDEEKSEKATK